MANADQQVATLLAAAGAARQRGDKREESRLVDAVLAVAPDHPVALNSRGMRALAENDLEIAVDNFRRAAMADPKEPALWMNLANAYRQRRDDAGERNSLERALAADQQHFMAWLRKAELHERLGELAQAARCWQGALALGAAIDPLPTALAETLARAQAFVMARTEAFTSVVEAELAADRDTLAPGDRRRFDACINGALGKRRIYANECSGVHFPFLPADEFFEREHFPWMAEIEAKTDIIRREFSALLADRKAGFRPYVRQDEGTPSNKWTPLDGSLDWSACFLWEYGVKQAEACARCPETVAALEALPLADIPGRAPTAFFSLLKPRKRIPPHTGVSNTRAIVHLPLIVPEGCGFRVGGETRAWRVGEAFAFDDTIEHEAWNDSDEPRAVLIFDVWNPHLTATEQRLLQRFYSVADNSGHNAEPKAGS